MGISLRLLSVVRVEKDLLSYLLLYLPNLLFFPILLPQTSFKCSINCRCRSPYTCLPNAVICHQILYATVLFLNIHPFPLSFRSHHLGPDLNTENQQSSFLPSLQLPSLLPMSIHPVNLQLTHLLQHPAFFYIQLTSKPWGLKWSPGIPPQILTLNAFLSIPPLPKSFIPQIAYPA